MNDVIQSREQVLFQKYEDLRLELVRLLSNSEPNLSEVDRVIEALRVAQMEAKAENGLLGNNPSDDGLEERAKY